MGDKDLDEGPYRTMKSGQPLCGASPTLADVLWGLPATQDDLVLCWGLGQEKLFAYLLMCPPNPPPLYAPSPSQL